jgi:hypothetical protein
LLSSARMRVRSRIAEHPFASLFGGFSVGLLLSRTTRTSTAARTVAFAGATVASVAFALTFVRSLFLSARGVTKSHGGG